MINPYELLGVGPDSHEKEVKKAYYRLCQIVHPDRGGSKEDMIALQHAYRTILGLQGEDTRETCPSMHEINQEVMNLDIELVKAEVLKHTPPSEALDQIARRISYEYSRRYLEELILEDPRFEDLDTFVADFMEHYTYNASQQLTDTVWNVETKKEGDKPIQENVYFVDRDEIGRVLGSEDQALIDRVAEDYMHQFKFSVTLPPPIDEFTREFVADMQRLEAEKAEAEKFGAELGVSTGQVILYEAPLSHTSLSAMEIGKKKDEPRLLHAYYNFKTIEEKMDTEALDLASELEKLIAVRENDVPSVQPINKANHPPIQRPLLFWPYKSGPTE